MKMFGIEFAEPSLELPASTHYIGDDSDGCPAGSYMADDGSCKPYVTDPTADNGDNSGGGDNTNALDGGASFSQFLKSNAAGALLYASYQTGRGAVEFARTAVQEDGGSPTIEAACSGVNLDKLKSWGFSAFAEWMDTLCTTYYYELNGPGPSTPDQSGVPCTAAGNLPGITDANGNCTPTSSCPVGSYEQDGDCYVDSFGQGCTLDNGKAGIIDQYGTCRDKGGSGGLEDCPAGQARNAKGECVPTGGHQGVSCSADQTYDSKTKSCVPKGKPGSKNPSDCGPNETYNPVTKACEKKEGKNNTKTDEKPLWPWILGGVAVAAAVGGGIYVATSKKGSESSPEGTGAKGASKNNAAKTSEPARASNPHKGGKKHKSGKKHKDEGHHPMHRVYNPFGLTLTHL